MGSDSEHWAHSFYRENTHLWPCKRGEIGGRLICKPVERSYYSNDGWLKNMDFCPVNYTTTQKGRTKCDPWETTALKGLILGRYHIYNDYYCHICTRRLFCYGRLAMYMCGY